MTDAMCAYLSMNQLLLGKKVKELPTVALDYLKQNHLVDDYAKAAAVKRGTPSKLCKMFVNMLRAGEYAFNVPDGSKQPLTLGEVANLAREKGYQPDTCAHWAIYLIHEVKQSGTGEDYVADGVLYLTSKTEKAEPDLEQEVRHAFSLYTYGVINPNARQMSFAQQVVKFMTIDGDTSITLAQFSKLLRGFVVSQVSPSDLGAYTLQLDDLSILLRRTHALCSWVNGMRQNVRVIVPRASSQTTIVYAVLPVEQFTTIIKTTPNAFVGACARGQRLVFKEKILQEPEE